MSQESMNPEITSDDKLWAMLGYLIPLIALVALLMEEKKRFSLHHINLFQLI